MLWWTLALGVRVATSYDVLCEGSCAVRPRSLLQQNASAVLQPSSHAGESSDDSYALSLLVVRESAAEDWTSIVLPSIAVFVLLVSFAIYMTPNKAEAPTLPRGSVSLPGNRPVPVMPRPSAARSSRPTAGPTVRPASLVLCADLTVPDGVECTLNVPRLSFLQTNAQVNVTDSKGGPVFRVKFSHTPDRDGTRLVLTNPGGDITFATATDSRTAQEDGSSRAALTIINPKDPSRQYLLEDKTGGDFQVTNMAGQFVRFLAIPGGFNAIDDKDQLLAFLDPPVQQGASQVARVGPMVDAGLMVMCFLAIGVLNGDERKPAKK